MARPYRLYEQALAKIEGGKDAIAEGKGRRRHIVKAQSVGAGRSYKRIDVGAMIGQQDAYSFPNELMTKKQLAKRTGVPYKVIKELIRDGHLTAIQFPGYRYRKYAAKQLERLIKNFNRLS